MYGEKLPPRDTDAEAAVIGSLLIDGPAIYRIATFLEGADFYSSTNREIYQACVALYERNEAINQITVAQELSRQNKLEACGGAAYLSQLVADCPTSLDIEHYAQIVFRLATMRNLITAGRQIEEIGYAADPDVEGSLNRAEDILYKLSHAGSSLDFVHIKNVLARYLETSPTPDTAADQQLPYVLSSFHGVDEYLGGFQRSDLIIVAGRPSMGKTSFALNIVRNAAMEQGASAAIFSLEMSRESLAMRLLSSESGINIRKFYFEHRMESEEQRIMDAVGRLSEANIYIDDTPMLRVMEMRSKARRLHHERGLDLVVVDYLQLMQGDSRTGNRVEEIGNISRSLKALARELRVPVIAVSQLSRAVEWRASHKPQLSDLRESGSIEQDADVVLFIYRDDYYSTREEWQSEHTEDEPYPEGIAEAIIAKHRNGPTGQVSLRFLSKLAKFENLTQDEPSLL